MILNQAGIDLVKEHEGCRLTAYCDPGSGGEPWTIGYGHTGGVVEGQVWTQPEADNALISDLNNTAAKVTTLLTTELTDNQFSALVSFAYNCGVHNLAASTLLKLTNEGDIANAANEFVRWDKASGHVMQGLLNRREAERALFLTA